MLQNRIYRDEIVHKDKSYPGKHAAIVDQDLWDKVEKMLAANRVEHKNGGSARDGGSRSAVIYRMHIMRKRPQAVRVFTRSHVMRIGTMK